LGIYPAGNGDEKKIFTVSVRGDPAGKFFGRGDGDGELFSDGDFPVAIPTPGQCLHSLEPVGS
jgi:hypothetical protein